jgi:hypothetical protein
MQYSFTVARALQICRLTFFVYENHLSHVGVLKKRERVRHLLAFTSRWPRTYYILSCWVLNRAYERHFTWKTQSADRVPDFAC